LAAPAQALARSSSRAFFRRGVPRLGQAALPLVEAVAQGGQQLSLGVRLFQHVADDPNADVLRADLTEPDLVLNHETVNNLIDFSRPVYLLLVAVAHFLPDTEALIDALARYRDALPAGSYLITSHASYEGSPEEAERARQVYNRTTSPLVLRSRSDFAQLLHGWDLVEPGLTSAGEWRPDPDDPPRSDVSGRSVIVAVARKP
jgi:hypothetical protein